MGMGKKRWTRLSGFSLQIVIQITDKDNLGVQIHYLILKKV